MFSLWANSQTLDRSYLYNPNNHKGYNLYKSLSHFTVFAGAVFIYAFWGTPTPDSFGVSEVIIALCLCYAVMPMALKMFLQMKWQTLFVVFGVFFPMLIGVFQNNDGNAIIRDVLAFLFVCFPVLLIPLFNSHRSHTAIFLISCVVVGLVFSVRGLMVSIWMIEDQLDYFSNSCLVLFSAIILFASGIYFICVRNERSSISRIGIGIICFLLCLIPIAAMATTLQRASIGCFLFSCVSLLFYSFRYSFVKPVLIALAIVIFAYIFSADIVFLTKLFNSKTQIYGGNMRIAEALAVINTLSHDWIYILFGHGWGASFQSPAVADIRVTYTHSFFTSMILKTGFVGLCAVVTYMIWIGRSFFSLFLLRADFKGMALLFALFGAFVIPLFLYANYKSFDFGLLLLLIVVSRNILIVDRDVTAR